MTDGWTSGSGNGDGTDRFQTPRERVRDRQRAGKRNPRHHHSVEIIKKPSPGENPAARHQAGPEPRINSMRGHQSVIAVTERSQVGEARREANRLRPNSPASARSSAGTWRSLRPSSPPTSPATPRRGGCFSRPNRPASGTPSSFERRPRTRDGERRGCLTDGYSTAAAPTAAGGGAASLDPVFDLHSSVPGGIVLLPDRPAGPAFRRDGGKCFHLGVVGRPCRERRSRGRLADPGTGGAARHPHGGRIGTRPRRQCRRRTGGGRLRPAAVRGGERTPQRRS